MNKQFYEKQLSDLIRSNKDRKLKLAQRYGYDTIEGYKASLEKALSGFKDDSEEDVNDVKSNDKLDMVIAFDTTGSMRSYINSVKSHVNNLIPKLFKNSPDLRLKIVAFGDYEDKTSINVFGEAYQVLEMTNSKNDLIEFVNKAEDTFGGDSDEFYELVIKKINEETDWRTDAKKSVLLIADDAPHKVGYRHHKLNGANQIDWKVEAKTASKLGIQYDTLKINYNALWLEELSKITNGVSLDFKNSNKTSEIIEGLAYARSSEASYHTTMKSVVKSGDSELIGAYKQIGTLLD